MRNFGSILVALDFSDCSQELVDKAADLAQSSTRIILLHVAGVPNGLAPLGGPTAARSLLLERSRERLAGYGQSVASASQSIVLELAEGPIAATIVEQAKRRQAELIVVGTHGRRGAARLIGGSIAAEVISLSDCPVVVVRASHKSTCRAQSCDRCDSHLTPELRQLMVERDG